MKKIILIFITVLFIGCDTAPVGVQVTFDDEKSNAIRAHYQNYLNNVEHIERCVNKIKSI